MFQSGNRPLAGQTIDMMLEVGLLSESPKSFFQTRYVLTIKTFSRLGYRLKMHITINNELIKIKG